MTPETSIYEYVKQGIEQNPRKVAIWFYGRAICYRELFEKIEIAAEQLASAGVGSGTVVTVRLPNCPQTAIAVYAVAKLGGICNMVHALLPAEGLRENMAFTESRVLISGNHLDDCEEIDFADSIFWVDISAYMGMIPRLAFSLKGKTACPPNAVRFPGAARVTQACFPEPSAFAKKCGLYMHSSGSTGEPKTAMLSHASLNYGVEMTKAYFRGTDMAKQVCLSALPLFHALGFQMDMHRVLSCNGTLIMMLRWNKKKAARLIKKHRVTVMVGVPAMYMGLLSEKAFSGPKIRQLRECFVGGEKMDAELKINIDQRLDAGDCPRVLEGYGLTETASVCAVLGKGHYDLNACGYPMEGVIAKVIDINGDLNTLGEGELIISAKSLMLGYLGDIEATASAFIEDNGKVFFRTGDYVRIDAEGLIYYIDRI